MVGVQFSRKCARKLLASRCNLAAKALQRRATTPATSEASSRMALFYAVQHVLGRHPDLSPEFVREKLWWSTFVNPGSNYMYYETPKSGSTTLKLLIHNIER